MIDWFHLKKKRENRERQEASKTGIYIENVPVFDRNGYKLKNILLNGSINGIIVVSSIVSVLEAFDVKYNIAVLTMVILMMCYFFAAFYTSTIFKIFGYFGVIAVFVYGIMEYRHILRGGFGTIANAFMEVIELELDLPIERRYSEFTQNKIYAVTLCGIFIGCTLALLFNIVITETKGVILVMMMTFPFVQLGLYFDRDINVTAFVVYMAGMIALMILRSSMHYKSETKRNKGYRLIRKKNKYEYDYVTDTRNSFSRMAGIIVMVIIAAFFVSVIIPKRTFRANEQFENWRDGTKDFAKKVALVGFWGMLNPNGNGNGGIGRSKLGQAEHVSLDYQKDLDVITAVFPEEETIYLRAYAGTTYEDNNWKYISEREPDGYKPLESYGISAQDVASLNFNLLWEDKENRLNNSLKLLKVYNTYANNQFMYIPPNTSYVENYFDSLSYDDEWQGGLDYGYGIKCQYFDLKDMELGQIEQIAAEIKGKNDHGSEIYDIEEKYRQYVYNTYLSVPEKNKKVIDKIFRENHITNDDGIDSIYQVISYLDKNYEYTLMPGRTPSKKDFVNYFLEDNKKGYCTYFASSAVLMFRELGIPARYVGGYMVSTTDDDYMHEAGRAVDADERMVWGEKSKEDYKVYDIEVNDSNAHAWTEVYVDNLGWVPVEVTPATDEEEDTQEDTNGIGAFLTNVFFNSQTAQVVKQTTIATVFVLLSAVLIFLIIIIITVNVLRWKRKGRMDIEKNFRYLERVVKAAGFTWNHHNTFIELAEEISQYGLCSHEDAVQLVTILERKRYSSHTVSDMEMQEVNRIILSIADRIYERLSWVKKIKYKYLF